MEVGGAQGYAIIDCCCGWAGWEKELWLVVRWLLVLWLLMHVVWNCETYLQKYHVALDFRVELHKFK